MTSLNQHLIDRLSQIRHEPMGKAYLDGIEFTVGPRRSDRLYGLAEGDAILTPQSLADWLQIPVTTVRELCRKRAQARDRYPLPFFHVGKRVRFNKREVLTWLTKLEAARKN
jgi:hypothetical protein